MKRADPEPVVPEAPGIPLAVPTPSTSACLFLDVDGTVIDFAATPDEVRIDPPLIDLLRALRLALSGALALISGRSIAALDRLFHPLQLPSAGVHGFERRDATGVVHRRSMLDDTLMSARVVLAKLVAEHEGLLLEDKEAALAVHYRRAPELEDLVRSTLTKIPGSLAPGFELLEGDAVMEIKPASTTKATAIEAYMKEAPFVGRAPVFIGDDLTDYDGFAAIRRHSGMAIAVGNRVVAQWRLENPAATRDWLHKFAKIQARLR